MKKSTNKKLYTQILEYLLAGGAFFWSSYLAFAIFDSLLGWPLFAAKQAANVIGLTVNFLLQNKWVFPSRTKIDIHGRTGRYLLITLVNFAIDYVIVAGLKEAGLTPYLGQFVSAGFFTFWNYFWYKHWVFAHHLPHHKMKRVRR